MDDFMELNFIVPLEDGWFLNKQTNMKFRVEEDGSVWDEEGNMLVGPDTTEDDV